LNTPVVVDPVRGRWQLRPVPPPTIHAFAAAEHQGFSLVQWLVTQEKRRFSRVQRPISPA